MLLVIGAGPKLCVGEAVDFLHSNSLSDLSEATDHAAYLPHTYAMSQEVEQRPGQPQTRYLIQAGRLLLAAAARVRHEAIEPQVQQRTRIVACAPSGTPLGSILNSAQLSRFSRNRWQQPYLLSVHLAEGHLSLPVQCLSDSLQPLRTGCGAAFVVHYVSAVLIYTSKTQGYYSCA